MNTQIILQITLVIHLLALAIAIGITLANTIAQKQFWKLYDQNKSQGIAGFNAILKFRLFGIMGLMLLIITGIIMLWLYQWTMAELLWFKLKMLVVLLLFINGFTLGRKTADRLAIVINSENNLNEVEPETKRLRRQMNIFQIIQLALFVVVIILAIFRFQ